MSDISTHDNQLATELYTNAVCYGQQRWNVTSAMLHGSTYDLATYSMFSHIELKQEN